MKMPEDGVAGCVRIGERLRQSISQPASGQTVCGLLMVSVESILIRDL